MLSATQVSTVFTRIRRPALLALLAIFSITFSQPGTTAGKPWVKVISGGGGLASLFYDCVQYYQAQGLGIKQAIGQCMAIGVVKLSKGGSGLNAGFFGNSEQGPVGIQCATLSADPRASGIVHRQPGSHIDPGRPPLGGLGSFENHLDSYSFLLGLLAEEFAAESIALREQAFATSDPAQKKNLESKAKMLDDLSSEMFDRHSEETMKWYLDRVEDYEKTKTTGTPPGDYPIPDPDAPQVSHIDPNHVSSCETLSAFVSDCQMAGWQTAPCQMFIDQLNGCGDPTITDPSPDGEQPCKAQPASAQQVKHITFVACSKETKPGPGQDPCGGTIGKGKSYSFNYGRNNPNARPCSNPFAYPSEDGCSPTFTVVVSDEKSIQDVINEAWERLGGPIFVVPVAPGVDPRTGGGCAGDPRCPH